MKNGYTHITLVCDRSGSMNVVRSDAEGAVNQFIEDQKTVPGEATLTLIEFDAGSEDWYHEVFSGEIRLAIPYKLHPRGGTALLDAIGRSINDTGTYLAAMPEHERPEHVVFVVQTDGEENSSKDWTVPMVRDKIKEQEQHFNWQFVFLGMGPDTFQQGHNMGFTNVANSAQSGAAYGSTYAVVSESTRGLRTNSVKDMSATNVTVSEDGTVEADD